MIDITPKDHAGPPRVLHAVVYLPQHVFADERIRRDAQEAARTHLSRAAYQVTGQVAKRRVHWHYCEGMTPVVPDSVAIRMIASVLLDEPQDAKIYGPHTCRRLSQAGL